MSLMSVTSNADRLSASFGVYIADVQRLFEFHGIDTAIPYDSSRLADVLTSKAPLRADLLSLAAVIKCREPNALTDSDLLTLVALALSGPQTPKESQLAIPVALLDEFTNGLKSLGLTGDNAMESLAAETPLETPGATTTTHLSADSARLARQRASSILEVPPSGRAAELDEPLRRLERKNIQLQQHLDAIEQRVSRIEPHLEGMSPLAQPSPQVAAFSSPRPISPPTIDRRILEENEAAPPVPTSGPASVLDRHPRTSAPTAITALSLDPESELQQLRLKRWRTAAFVLGALLFVFVALSAILAFRVFPLRSMLHGFVTRATRSWHDSSFGAPSTPFHPTTDKAPFPDLPASTAPITPAPAPTTLASPSIPMQVPFAVMLRNALSTTRPSYPDDLRAADIEGTIRIQTLIGKGGTVLAARVIRGPDQLRASATDAISSWRFKPFLVAGKPVLVNTYIDITYKTAWIQPVISAESPAQAPPVTTAPQQPQPDGQQPPPEN